MEERIQSFLDLNVWKKAHQLTLNIFKTTSAIPASEQFTITNKLKQSASTVAIAIAEGFQKRNKQEKVAAYHEAQSSLNTLNYLLLLTHDLQYLNTTALIEDTQEIQKMMNGLIRSILGLSKHKQHDTAEHHPIDTSDI